MIKKYAIVRVHLNESSPIGIVYTQIETTRFNGLEGIATRYNPRENLCYICLTKTKAGLIYDIGDIVKFYPEELVEVMP